MSFPRADRRQILAVLGAAVAAAAGGCAIGDPGLLPPGAKPGAPAAPEVNAAGDAPQPKPQTQIVMAMILPLSAPAPVEGIARALRQAGELAILELDDPRLRLVIKDDRGTPEGAAAAAGEAIKEGAGIILGPLMSASVKAVGPVARAAKVPVIAFSNDRQAQSPGVWVIGFQPEADVERVISYAVAQGRRRLVALISSDPYGQLVEAAFTRVAARLQANIVMIERYQGQASQMLEPMRRLADEIKRSESEGQPIDALFLPGGADLLASLGPVVAYAGIDPQRVKLIGTSGWDEPNLGRDAAFVGGWFPAPEPKAWQDFAERFGRSYGGSPPRIASLGYDAVRFAADVAQRGGIAPFADEQLTRGTLPGVDGPLRLKPDGGVERGLAVLEVQSFGATVLESATGEQTAARPGDVAPRPNFTGTH